MTNGKPVRGVLTATFLATVALTAATELASARMVEQRKYGLWTYQRFQGRIEWCGVSTTWPNKSMVLTFRLQRNHYDFFFFNSGWNLRKNRRMRDTVLQIGSARFYARTSTLNSGKAIFGTFRGSVPAFFVRFMAARSMRIYFPTNQSISVNLRGSSNAMRAAARCWRTYLNI